MILFLSHLNILRMSYPNGSEDTISKEILVTVSERITLYNISCEKQNEGLTKVDSIIYHFRMAAYTD